jgi:hypothetical protein
LTNVAHADALARWQDQGQGQRGTVQQQPATPSMVTCGLGTGAGVPDEPLAAAIPLSVVTAIAVAASVAVTAAMIFRVMWAS